MEKEKEEMEKEKEREKAKAKKKKEQQNSILDKYPSLSLGLNMENNEVGQLVYPDMHLKDPDSDKHEESDANDVHQI